MNGTKPGRRLRLLLHVDASQKISRGTTAGVLRYAAVHPDVEVRLYGPGTPSAEMEEFAEWRPDGLIVGGNAGKNLRIAVRLGIRAAVLAETEPPADCPLRLGSVFCDNAAVAREAAALFGERRLGHWAYVGADEPWSREREARLRELAERAGRPFHAFRLTDAVAARRTSALARWLAALPAPCGVLAANDLRAKEVLDACAEAGVAVPGRVLVLGTDDEEFVCRQTNPTLSSIVPDFAAGGYLEAETLVELLRGRRRRLPPRTYGVAGTERRLSTSDPNEARLMVGRAEEFIRENAGGGEFRIGDVAKAAFASTRLLQRNFKDVTGRTVGEALRDERLRRVRALLSETTTPIGAIAGLCGFKSDGYLKQLFRSRHGCTMRDWRRRARGR